ncbi:hypothetical protein NPIL_157951 [Nephila pilipes]|uniref:Uncharacterized protein n=1 Tax=Nephila pilipes TaxID=299642 RepID=A0A8X6QLU1_NEPPI|nr:hypothetical protein NPIL_157951 [Nephila pilipes]
MSNSSSGKLESCKTLSAESSSLTFLAEINSRLGVKRNRQIVRRNRNRFPICLPTTVRIKQTSTATVPYLQKNLSDCVFEQI